MVTEIEMVGWHHRLNGLEFEQTLGDSEGQGSLACCSSRGQKESDTTYQLNNSDNSYKEWTNTYTLLLTKFPTLFRCPCSVAQLCPTLCDSTDCSTPGLPIHHQLLEFTQTHVHWVSDAIQPSHPLSSPTPALNLSQHQGLFKWVSSSHQMAKVLEFQFQHQSFQWTPRTDLL